MPAPSDVEVPPDAAAVAAQYRRLERPVSGAVAVLVALIVVAAVLWLPFLQAVVVAVVTLAAVRVPVLRSNGSARLATDEDPGTVRADFEGPTPPLLALQWGIADAVRRTDGGAAYEIASLFGLRSTHLAVETNAPQADGRSLELVVTANGRPWGTYTVSIGGADGGTAVKTELRSNRRFGLRRLPQWLVAERYRVAALAAQGYTVVERDVGLSV